MTTKRRVKNLTDESYGKLLVIGSAGRKNKRAYWLCECNCGNRVEVRADRLTSGEKQDCGCVGKAHVAQRNRDTKSTHGLSGTRLFRIWSNMTYRCSNPKSPNYARYGGRGITVCEEWVNSVHEFIKWACNNGYAEDLTLDRLNVNGNYEPSNCRWATTQDQSLNRSDNVLVDIDGVSKTLVEWAKEAKINKYTMRKRYNILRWRGKDLLRPVE